LVHGHCLSAENSVRNPGPVVRFPTQNRLADAATAGCGIAVVTTQPESKSQQNVQRQGFDLLYTRAILVKQP
jgi:hypothetical protein